MWRHGSEEVTGRATASLRVRQKAHGRRRYNNQNISQRDVKPRAKDCRQPLVARKGKGMHSLLKPQKGHNLAAILI